MNVLFININLLSDKKSTNTVPLVCGYIAANLNANGHNGYIVDDVRDLPLTLKYLENYLNRLQPRIICFSAYHYQMDRIRYFARFIKQFNPEIVIVLGGPQIVFMPAQALEDLDDVDIICNRGEGEAVLLEIANSMASCAGFRHIEGIAYKENGKITDNPAPKCFTPDLDIYPSPYINDVINLSGKTMATLLTSRGCEHICNFCATPYFYHKKIQFHSIERVLDEMECLTKKGINRFWIADPNFTAYRERTVKLMEEKIERGIKTPFWCQTRVDLVDEELLDLMRKAGLDTIGFGLESGSDEVLNKMHKDVTVEHFHRMVKYAQSIGLEVELFSMYGQPNETVEDAKKTLDIVRKYKITIYANSHAQQLQLYFGSAYARSPERFGLKIDNTYRPNYLSAWFDYETDKLNKNDLTKIQALWSLYNAETELNAKNRFNIFHSMDLLLTNRDSLKEEKRFYEMVVNLSSLVEHTALVKELIDQYIKLFSPDKRELFSVLSQVEAYSEVSSGVVENSRVIFYCEYDQPLDSLEPPIKSGLNDFRYDIPKGVLIGMKKNETKMVSVNLNKKVNQYITVLSIYERKKIKTIKELKDNLKTHDYSFLTYEMLGKSSDELLLYLALNSTPLGELIEMPAVYLNLVSFYAKLHRFREIENCFNFARTKLNATEKIAESIGDIISRAGRYTQSLSYFDKAKDSDDLRIKKAYALVYSSQFSEAYKILSGMPNNSSLLYNELLMECLRNVKPEEKSLIKKIDREVLNLRVQDAWDNETSMQAPGFHGKL